MLTRLAAVPAAPPAALPQLSPRPKLAVMVSSTEYGRGGDVVRTIARTVPSAFAATVDQLAADLARLCPREAPAPTLVVGSPRGESLALSSPSSSAASWSSEDLYSSRALWSSEDLYSSRASWSEEPYSSRASWSSEDSLCCSSQWTCEHCGGEFGSSDQSCGSWPPLVRAPTPPPCFATFRDTRPVFEPCLPGPPGLALSEHTANEINVPRQRPHQRLSELDCQSQLWGKSPDCSPFGAQVPDRLFLADKPTPPYAALPVPSPSSRVAAASVVFPRDIRAQRRAAQLSSEMESFAASAEGTGAAGFMPPRSNESRKRREFEHAAAAAQYTGLPWERGDGKQLSIAGAAYCCIPGVHFECHGANYHYNKYFDDDSARVSARSPTLTPASPVAEQPASPVAEQPASPVAEQPAPVEQPLPPASPASPVRLSVRNAHPPRAAPGRKRRRRTQTVYQPSSLDAIPETASDRSAPRHVVGFASAMSVPSDAGLPAQPSPARPAPELPRREDSVEGPLEDGPPDEPVADPFEDPSVEDSFQDPFEDLRVSELAEDLVEDPQLEQRVAHDSGDPPAEELVAHGFEDLEVEEPPAYASEDPQAEEPPAYGSQDAAPFSASEQYQPPRMVYRPPPAYFPPERSRVWPANARPDITPIPRPLGRVQQSAADLIERSPTQRDVEPLGTEEPPLQARRFAWYRSPQSQRVFCTVLVFVSLYCLGFLLLVLAPTNKKLHKTLE